MPKAQHIEEKYINGIRVDKENETCAFNDEKHLYFDKKTMQPYISVTQIISKYCQEFDEEFWSFYKALESFVDKDIFYPIKKTLLARKKVDKRLIKKLGLDLQQVLAKQEEIKLEYKRKRDESCERGVNIHAAFENSFYNRTKFDFSKYEYKDLAGEFICIENRNTLAPGNGVYPEFLISVVSRDGILRLSGQIDCLIIQGNDVYIIDWKGLDINTPILTDSGWKTMGTLTIKDKVFDRDGNLVNIKHISDIHYNPCYKITFDNGDELIADEDHKWIINLGRAFGPKDITMSTKELYNWIKSKPRKPGYIPRIYNPSPLKIKEKKLPIDPYVLGAWLGDGSKYCGIITNVNENFWKEIQRRGYTISKNLTSNSAEEHTIYGLSRELRKLNLIENKHIPTEYLLGSYQQRLDLLRGLMDTDGFLHKKRKRFVMETSQRWQVYDFAELLATFGLKPTIFDTVNKLNGKEFPGWMVCWTNDKINPFLTRNQKEFDDIKVIKDNNSFRNIKSVELVDTVPTKCIETDSPSHTYLCGKSMIVTHNSNSSIDKTSYYNRSTKQHQMMKFPLNNRQDCNFEHYQLQLSLYAYMLQQINPNYNIKGLKLVHIDHDNKQHEYDVEYLKDDVERMLKHYKRELKKQIELDKLKPVIC